MFTVLSLDASPLEVPLREPFVIATGRIDRTRAVLLRVRVRDEASGREAEGLGEAACLPPITREDGPELLVAAHALAPGLLGQRFSVEAGPELLDGLEDSPVLRAALETALLDAAARCLELPLHRLLGGPVPAPVLVTDVTIPIGTPSHMAELAAGWRARGFTIFKVKLGKDASDDRAALEAIAAAVPDAVLRLDANEGMDGASALALLGELAAKGLRIECFEQPCPRPDLAGMAQLCAGTTVPIVADESVRSESELRLVLTARAATGVNLKLVKVGGPRRALAIGRAARAAGLKLMMGGMVETTLGMTAAAHVAAALGGVDFVDLDTALLLEGDPMRGGYEADGPRLTLLDRPGLGVTT